MDISFFKKLNKQSLGKYESLMNSIAVSALVCFVFIYVGGYTLEFWGSVMYEALGGTNTFNFIFLIIQCIADFATILVPVKIFNFMNSSTYSDEYMPVEKKILPEGAIPYVLLLGLSANHIVALFNDKIVDLFGNSNSAADFLYRGGFQYNYQIFFYLFSISVIPAIAEEIFCRKALCNALAPYGQKTSIIVSALVFSLLHADFARFIYTFVFGIAAAWLYVGTKSLKWSMLMHFINNFLAGLSIVLYYKVSSDAYNIFNTILLIVYIPMAIICVWRLLKIKKERDDIERLAARVGGTLEQYNEHKKKYAKRLEMLPTEDGEEIIPLTRKEKSKGFFSPLMIVYIVIALLLALGKFYNQI